MGSLLVVAVFMLKILLFQQKLNKTVLVPFRMLGSKGVNGMGVWCRLLLGSGWVKEETNTEGKGKGGREGGRKTLAVKGERKSGQIETWKGTVAGCNSYPQLLGNMFIKWLVVRKGGVGWGGVESDVVKQSLLTKEEEAKGTGSHMPLLDIFLSCC